MSANWVGALLALAVGVVIAWINYAMSRRTLKHRPALYGVTDVLRRLLQVGFLVALFFLGEYTPWDRMWLLVGGCLGITLPLAWFTYRLVKLNNSLDRKEESSDG